MEKKKWLDKLNGINSKILMPAVFFTFLLFNTVLNLWLGGKIESAQSLLIIMITAIVIFNLIISPKEAFLPWLKVNYLIPIYFVVRVISFWDSGMDYSVARTMFFEMFFLIGIAKITTDKKAIKKIYIYAFLIFELIFTLPCLVIYYMGEGAKGTTLRLLNEYTYYPKANTAALFSNPNTAGIMAAFAILLLAVIYKKSWSPKVKALAGIFTVYNVLFLIAQDTRSAELGIIAVILGALIKVLFKSINRKTICYLVLTGCIVIVGIIYGFIQYNMVNDGLANTKAETQINHMSSGRYSIWKGCVIEQKDHLLFGAGNLALEQKNRKETLTLAKGYVYDMRLGATFGPHNGYIGMISGAGWLGFLVFMGILFQRIKRAKSLNSGNWYLVVVFILAINLFESLFILNRFFTCFYLFLILEMDERDENLVEEKI